MKIPTRFKLFHHIINVNMKKDLQKNEDLWGLASFRRKIINIEPNLDKTYKEQTFVHELVHMILNFMAEYEQSKDEKFVQLFSELLYQALETMEYKNK